MPSIHLLADTILNGLLLGGTYALAALGLSLVFGIMDVVNLAHGHLLMLGGYVAVIVAMTLGLSPLVGMVVAIVVLFAVGVAIQQLLRPVVDEGIEQPILLLFGVALVIQNGWEFVLSNYLFGTDARSTSLQIVSGGFSVAGLGVGYARAVTFVLALVLVGLTWALLQYTQTGRAIRATAQNATAARYMGIDTARVYSVTLGLGAALAGAAGALLSMLFPFDPTVGFSYLLKAFAVVVLGGAGNVIGTLIGGLVLGVSENAGALFLGGSYRNIVSFAIFLIVLLVRPEGLFGTTGGDE